MKIFRYINICILFVLINTSSYSEISPSVPSTSLQNMASSISYTSTAATGIDLRRAIRKKAARNINTKQLIAVVLQDAKALGLKIDKEGLKRLVTGGVGKSGKDKDYKVDAAKQYKGREELKPTLGTYKYDSGLMNLSRNTDYSSDTARTVGGAAVKQIFHTGVSSQQARIKVYIDFKNKVQWGELHTRVRLKDDARQKRNTISAAPSAVTSIPIDRQMQYGVRTSGNGSVPTDGVDDDQFYPQGKHTINSLKLENGNLAGGYELDSDYVNMKRIFSHGGTINAGSDTDANGSVLMQAHFKTATAGGAGSLTASMEAAGIAPNTNDPDSDGSANSNDDVWRDSIVRFDSTVTVKAKKHR
jgi:hypothetical protein